MQTPASNDASAQISTLSKNLAFGQDALEVVEFLHQQSLFDNGMLLETSEIKSSIDQQQPACKSIIMLQAAVRIECVENEIKLTALNPNGQNALLIIKQHLNQLDDFALMDKALMNKQSDQALLTLQYQLKQSTLNTQQFDEDTKLKQVAPVDILRQIKSAFKEFDNEYSVFLCGLLSFDLIASTENFSPIKTGSNTAPDFVFYLSEKLIVIDHQKNQQRLYCNHFKSSLIESEQLEKTYFQLAREFESLEFSLINNNRKPSNKALLPAENELDNAKIKTDISHQAYQTIVKNLKQNIIQGDVFQVVPARTFSMDCNSPLSAYRALKKSNPSPYLFYMQDKDFTLFGASPESALKYTNQTNQVELYPIAGTRPRGKKANGEIDTDLDIRIEAELKLDQKEVAEHIMLVDLARNDIARISDAGTIKVNKFLDVDRYSQVMHLVSTVSGQLRQDLDALHAYKACMNMGTLTGAPKVKATELLRKVENKRRGSYGGAVGYINAKGDMDTCIVIRSAFCQKGLAHVQAGAGIVFDSDPKAEALETEAKAKAVLLAIQNANQLSNKKAERS